MQKEWSEPPSQGSNLWEHIPGLGIRWEHIPGLGIVSSAPQAMELLQFPGRNEFQEAQLRGNNPPWARCQSFPELLHYPWMEPWVSSPCTHFAHPLKNPCWNLLLPGHSPGAPGSVPLLGLFQALEHAPWLCWFNPARFSVGTREKLLETSMSGTEATLQALTVAGYQPS